MLASEQTQPSVCINHQSVETALFCNRCEAPICGSCAMNTEVGMRCPACSGRQTALIYDLSGPLLARAAVVGAPVAIAIGLGMGHWLAWSFWWSLLLGIAVGEAVARGANERRGVQLQVIAGICVVLALAIALWWHLSQGFGLTLAEIAEILRTPKLYSALGLTAANGLFAALALFLATRRVR